VIHSKRYNTARGQSDALKTYQVADACKVLSGFPKAKFDETVELALNLGVDLKANVSVRGVINLPKGSGKKVRVVVFTAEPDVAKAAGADEAGLADLIAKVEGGWADFDVAVATTSAMKEVRKIAKVLGPKGLMPNPKSGTVTDDVVSAVKSIKLGGRVEFKMDKTGNISLIVGKRSFTPEDIAENINTAIAEIAKVKPAEIKTRYIKSMSISSSMSPSVKIDSSVYASL
jgi:large subunit ribosomal protein L1